VNKGVDCLGHNQVKAAVADAEQTLNGKGRVLLRPSGTEPLLRVMVEGEDQQLVETIRAAHRRSGAQNGKQLALYIGGVNVC